MLWSWVAMLLGALPTTPSMSSDTRLTKTESKTTRTLLGAKGIATRSKDATRGSWPYY